MSNSAFDSLLSETPTGLLQNVLNAVPHAIGVFKIAESANGEDDKFEALFFNTSALQIPGLINKDASGKSCHQSFASPLAPTILTHFKYTAEKGKPVEFEINHPAAGRLLHFKIVKQGAMLVVTITDAPPVSKPVLKEGEDQKTFMLQLSDALRAAADPVEIQLIAAERLGLYLNLGRCGYGEIDESGKLFTVERDWTNGQMESLSGTIDLTRFGRGILHDYEQGHTVRVDDSFDDDRIRGREQAYTAIGGLRGGIGVPLVKNNRLVAIFYAHDTLPRKWADTEIAMIEETAEHIWATVERARAEKRLRQSEEKYRTLFDSIDEGYCIIKMLYDDTGKATDWRFIEVNRAFELNNGLYNAQGKTIRELAPDIEPKWVEIYNSVAQTGQSLRFEEDSIALGRTFTLYAFPIGNPAEHLVAVIFTDISENKRTETTLRQSEARFRKLLEGIAHCFWETDAEGSIVNDSPSWRKYTGQTLDEWLGYGWLNAIHPDDRAYAERQWREAVAAVRMVNAEFRIITRDGSYRYNNVRAVPLQNSKGNIEKWVGMNIDIEEGKRTEQDIKMNLWYTQILRDLSAKLIGENNLQIMFDEVLTTAIKLLDADAGSIQLLDKDHKQILLLAAKGVSDELITNFNQVTADSGTSCGRALFTGKRHFIDFDDPTLTDTDGSAIMHLKHGLISAQSTPLVSGSGKYIGMISTHWQKRYRPDERQLHFLDLLARQAADLIEQRQYAQALDEAQERLSNFNQLLAQQVADQTAELRQSKDQLQSVFDTSLIQMSILEAVRDQEGIISDFKIKLVNRELENATGRTDLIGKLYGIEFPGIKAAGVFDLIIKTIETGEPQQMEYLYPYDGFYKWFSCMFIKLDDGVVATNLDITNRKQAEEERFKNMLQLQQAEKLALLGSWDYNLLNDTLSWSDGLYRLFDLPKGTEVGLDIYLKYATAQSRPAAKRIVDNICSGNVDFEDTIELIISGHVRIIRLKATVSRNQQNRAVRVLGVDMDITVIQAAEEKIRQMEAGQQLEIFKQTLNTQEEERRRISESLHNGLGQLLYGIKISMANLTQKQAVETPQAFLQAKTYTDELLMTAISESRRISHELVPLILEDFGLKAAIEDICHQLTDQVQFYFVIRGFVRRIDKYMELAIYRTVQELMLNVVKHAKATKATVELAKTKTSIQIIVADNGSGIISPKTSKPGIGLASIQNKIKLLNGTVKITSNVGKGTHIEIRIPFQEHSNRA